MPIFPPFQYDGSSVPPWIRAMSNAASHAAATLTPEELAAAIEIKQRVADGRLDGDTSPFTMAERVRLRWLRWAQARGMYQEG